MNLFEALQNETAINALPTEKGEFVIEETLGTGLLFATLFKKKPADYALIASNQYSAQRLYEFLLNFLEEGEVVFFPNDELLRAESLASSRELLSQRVYALAQLLSKKKKILVTHPSALLRYLPDPGFFEESIIDLKVGQTVDLKQLKAKLIKLGYQAQNKIDRSLQFASRGDILDIYSVSYLDPIRIEFFGDEIETIRFFDIQSYQSKKNIEQVSILPATDLLLSDDQLEGFIQRLRIQIEEDIKLLGPAVGEDLRSFVGSDIEHFENRNYRNELYRYMGFAMENAFSVLHYFKPEITYITSKQTFFESIERLEDEANAYYGELFANGHTISHLRHYMDVSDATRGMKKVVYGTNFASGKEYSFTFNPHSIVSNSHSISTALPTILSYAEMNQKVVLCLNEPSQRKTILSMLDEQKVEYEYVDGFEFPQGHIGISHLVLSEGFEIPSLSTVYLNASDLFGHRTSSSRFMSRFKEASILKSYEELRPGDYVVHEYNGIGQFLDIKTIEVDGVHRDFLHIAYANNEFLYVPLEQFRLVRKYAGREGAVPKLSHLSSGEWKKKKAKIKERINELADRLIALYGNRVRNKGFAFPKEEELQAKFEEEFPYPLTPDQQKAVDEIKSDMESDTPMDRLICGDVGFGKTEVAFRAAFKAIAAGKQVALLCPTTLLARQHYEVALERFASFGIRICLFSRLVPESDQHRYIEGLKAGKVDFAIGTHKLLSKQIEFKDLGLLIVDEEQRFGVEQKERIKEIMEGVDSLTLSATPIPRTLQMSLVGIRPLSEINTAPTSRMPIQTYVTPFKRPVVDELISRELARNGQVFYLHNVVATIYNTASLLASRIPNASVGVVHGQMAKEEIEDVMQKFYDNELNVLVCTSIVENGIDIPNANMLIVEDADKFGLSQLYQIKGRVGRGNRIAYAYLMYREQKKMNDDAKKRLQAIQEFTEFGSGYKIAQRDLLIRGAGDILGPEQAGFIDSVGLDLYLKLLNEAVTERKTGEVFAEQTPKKLFAIDAYIPGEYASESDKLQLYQELEEIKNERDLQAFTKKMKDIYGKLPKAVDYLIRKKEIDLFAEKEEFESFEENENEIIITLSSAVSRINGIGNDLFEALVPYLNYLKVSFVNKRVTYKMRKKDDWLRNLYQILKKTHDVYDRVVEATKD